MLEMKDKTYTKEEVIKSTSKFLRHEGNSIAVDAFFEKYCLTDNEGCYHEENPKDSFWRQANVFAKADEKLAGTDKPLCNNYIYSLLVEGYLKTQGSGCSAIGNDYQIQSASNCFVIKAPYDSYAGIFLTDQEQGQIMKRRGGVGFDISTLRPKGFVTRNAARTSTGLASFMDRYSNTTREVAQGGRRGALMLTCSVHHPDVLDFINKKRDLKLVTGANVSVKFTDEFMNAVVANEKYEQRFPVDSSNPAYSRMVDAREVFQQVAAAQHACAEPCILFWDTIVRNSPADCYPGFDSESTNPCSELPMCPYDSCRLMYIPVSRYVVNPFTSKAYFNWATYIKMCKIAQRLSDDLVEIELDKITKIIDKICSDPEPEHVKKVELMLWNKIYETTREGRRTGLGISALGDAIAMMNLQYGSEESIAFTYEIYKTLAESAYSESIRLAKVRGAFPVFKGEFETGNEYLERLGVAGVPRRNIACLTTAPVGTSSMLDFVTYEVPIESGTTSGIEPTIYLSALRKRKVTGNEDFDSVDEQGDRWKHYQVDHPGLKLWKQITGETDETKSPYFSSTVQEIDPISKIRLLGAAQKWVDHAISNTTNLPKDVSRETIEDLILEAWKQGCKGVTVYREGSRDAVIRSVNDDVSRATSSDAPKRPNELPCDVFRITADGSDYLVLVGLLDGKPYEIFAGNATSMIVPGDRHTTGKIVKFNIDGRNVYNLVVPVRDKASVSFNDIVYQFENNVYGTITRLVSTSLRHGVPVQFIAEQLKKNEESLVSFSSALARVLSKNYVKEGTKVSGEQCSECKQKSMVYTEGCSRCLQCGYTKCG